ncbi:hypothetical protein [Micromonospora sp. NPDC047134]|uniref:hypothetical protein n=1 Tax=Micromonospora sp. NPDC047134 TaxID=3154340 RepID=UPI0033C023AF
MRPGFGLSSGCAPDLTAEALAELVRRCGGDTVDLRAGKGHAWESAGVSPFADHGIDIAFIGVSVCLGDPRCAPEQVAETVRPWSAYPVKVFTDPGTVCGDRALLRAQLDALTEDRPAAAVLMETHHGRALPNELRELHDRYGLGVLLDTAGLAAVTDDQRVALALLAPAVTAVQVKGFTLRPGGGSDHHPLGEDDIAGLVDTLLPLRGRLRAVTIESRAGTPDSDLRHTMAAWSLARNRS